MRALIVQDGLEKIVIIAAKSNGMKCRFTTQYLTLI